MRLDAMGISSSGRENPELRDIVESVTWKESVMRFVLKVIEAYKQSK